jgi:CTP synthase
MSKFVFVTGGVLSSLGKGITASSLGAIFKAKGYRVMIKKFDPYLNFNPGMMSPMQHGEVFVTEDGGEGDLDLGHYERFIDTDMNKYCDITSGLIYYNVIENERKGFFHGNTVQVIPHITDEIKRWVMDRSEEFDVVFIEIGGTVGDIEGQPYLEAIRQMRYDLGDDSVAYIHVTPIFYVKTADELKTKPTQHSVQKLREIGITPDMLVCRSEYPLSDDLRRKLALFCNVKKECVINTVDAPSLYQVPLSLNEEGAGQRLMEKLKLEDRPADLSAWKNLVHTLENLEKTVRIGVIGKYVGMKDAYISLKEAIAHGGVAHKTKVDIEWIAAEELEHNNYKARLEGLDGILVPGGFGERGMEGKINAVNYARTNNIPFLGVGSLGMQSAVLEYARNVLKLDNAASTEMNANTPHPVICYIDKNNGATNVKGEMRLGAFTTVLSEGSLARRIYGNEEIKERHRHRLELNNKYAADLEKAGMSITGMDKSLGLANIIEIKSHRWFLACQYIPEYKSRPLRPHPLFVEFVAATLNK